MRSDKDRLLDILEAIEKIETRTSPGREAFDSDEMLQVWVIHHLQIIGEAAAHISSQFQREHPEIPWGNIIGMRHILVHGYFQIDLTIVWKAVERDLPDLKDHVIAIMKQ
jgi:uncharacterized protein with HEPN domain